MINPPPQVSLSRLMALEAVAIAAGAFRETLRAYAGPTADWPIRVQCDDPIVAARLLLFEKVLAENLAKLES